MRKANQYILFIAQLLLMMALLCSCVTWKKCVNKFGEVKPQPIVLRDTIKVPVEAIVPGDSLTGTIPCPDGRPDTSKVSGVSDTTTQKSDGGRAQIKYWYNQYLKAMEYRVDCLPDTIKDVKYIPVEIEGEYPDVVVVDPKNASGWSRWWHTYQVFSGWALLVGLIGWIIYRKTSNKTIMYVEKDTTQDH